MERKVKSIGIFSSKTVILTASIDHIGQCSGAVIIIIIIIINKINYYKSDKIR